MWRSLERLGGLEGIHMGLEGPGGAGRGPKGVHKGPEGSIGIRMGPEGLEGSGRV